MGVVFRVCKMMGDGMSAGNESAAGKNKTVSGDGFALWAVLCVCLIVGSCSFFTRDLKVSWEEEVLLNTGETIWVRRDLLYQLQGASGNPLDIKYSPSWVEVLTFNWHGIEYVYKGSAGIILVAISPVSKRPVLVADPTIKEWYRANNYKCTRPYYVQFERVGDGFGWVYSNGVEEWLFGLSYNLMLHKPKLDDAKKKYYARDRIEFDHAIFYQAPHMIRVDPNFFYDGNGECLR